MYLLKIITNFVLSLNKVEILLNKEGKKWQSFYHVLIKPHDNDLRARNVELKVFLTSALDGGKMSASQSCRLVWRKRGLFSCPLNMNLAWLKADEPKLNFPYNA
jgi:hypothetical protein